MRTLVVNLHSYTHPLDISLFYPGRNVYSLDSLDQEAESVIITKNILICLKKLRLAYFSENITQLMALLLVTVTRTISNVILEFNKTIP